MCRFLVYKGKEILIADLITKPSHSLIRQSYKAKERPEPLNGDGFGVGWYAPNVSEEPALITSITPAWGNRNLHRIADKILSPAIFAHVRAATPGLVVSDVNCHPFQHKNFLWMHNGKIAEFLKVKRLLRSVLRDELYNMIQGTTDSEHAFALFLNNLSADTNHHRSKTLTEAMLATIEQLNGWSKQVGVKETSFYNFALTDGKTTVVTRYCTPHRKAPATLYYLCCAGFEFREELCCMIPASKNTKAVVVSSEPLTAEKRLWKEVPANHLLLISDKLDIELVPIP